MRKAISLLWCRRHSKSPSKSKKGNRERVQIFEGFVLKKQNGGISGNNTVRKISSGVGVAEDFPAALA